MLQCPKCGGNRWKCYTRATVLYPANDHGEYWEDDHIEETFHTDDVYECWECDTPMVEMNND